MLKRVLHHDNYVIEIVLALCAMGPPMLSAMISLETGDGHWFQRSGSLMVLFSVAMEYRRSQRVKRGRPASSLPEPFGVSVPYVCYVSIAVGTLIWGYGDLLFPGSAPE